jgi:hypothetical protein
MGPTLPPSFVPIMRDGLPPREARGKPLLFGPEYDVRRERGLIIERNIPVPLRDGVRIYVDLYRAEGDAGAGPLPAILGWSPYGKHGLSDRLWPPADVDPRLALAAIPRSRRPIRPTGARAATRSSIRIRGAPG